MTLQIDFTVEISEEIKEYIFDCWVAFVTQDLGFEVSQALMREV